MRCVFKYRLLLSFVGNDCKPEIYGQDGSLILYKLEARRGDGGAVLLKSCGN